MSLTYRTFLIAGLFACLFTFQSADIRGQETTDAAASESTAQATASKRATEGFFERLIYLPYKQLRDVFDKQNAGVFIPYSEYMELRRLAGLGPSKPEKVPVAAIITESHYSARVEEELARITATFHVRVLGDAWSELPVRFGNAAVGSLKSDGEEVLLRGTGPGAYALLFPKKSNYIVELELSTRIHTSPDGRSFELDVPTVGITSFDLVIPEADQSVTIQPSGIAESAKAAEGQTHVRTNLGSTAKVSALWHPRVSAKPVMELLSSVSNYTRVRVADGLIHTDAFLHYDILRGDLRELQIAVPASHRVLGVSSSNAKVESWQLEQEGKHQVLTVKFLGNVAKNAVVEVHTERALPDEAFSIAGVADDGTYQGIHALDAVRESGQIVVTHADDITLVAEDQRGLSRIEQGEVHASIRRPNGFYFKFYSPKFTYRVIAKPVEPRITVDHTAQLIFRDDELRLVSQLNYQVERTGIFELTFKVPENLIIDAVNGDGVKDHNLNDETRELTVALRERRIGAFSIRVTGHQPLKKGEDQKDLTLPVIEPVNLFRETGLVQVYAPESIEVVVDREKLTSVQPDPAPQGGSIGNARLTSSWRFTRRPIQIVVQTQRRPTRLTSTVASSLNVREELVEVTTRLDYQVQYAGIDTFRFAVPEVIADRVQIRSLASAPAPGIKQKSRAEEAKDGWVTWTVVMQREVTGLQQFEITYDIKYTDDTKPQPVAEEPADDAAEVEDGDKEDAKPAEEDDAEAKDGEKPKPEGDAKADEGEAPQKEENPEAKEKEEEGDDGDADGRKLHIQPLRVLSSPTSTALNQEENEVPVSYISGEIVIQKDRALAVAATPAGDQLEAIDVRELTALPQDGFLAYRYFVQPVSLELNATKHEIEAVVETVVSRALVEVVIGRDNVASYRCRYRIKSSERQQLRIDMQSGSNLLGAWIDQQPVNLERDANASPREKWDAFLINVARTTPVDVPFNVAFQFTLPLAGFEGGVGSVELQLPQIGGFNNEGVVVQQLRTSVWIPEEFTLIGRPEGFIPEDSPVNLNNWIGTDTTGLFDFPTQGKQFVYSSLGEANVLNVPWWKMWFVTWVVSGTIFVVALVLRNTHWENKLGILIFAGLVLASYGLRDLDAMGQALEVSRYGFVALLALWFVHGIFSINLTTNNRLHPQSPIYHSLPTMAAVIPPPGIFKKVDPKQEDDRK